MKSLRCPFSAEQLGFRDEGCPRARGEGVPPRAGSCPQTQLPTCRRGHLSPPTRQCHHPRGMGKEGSKDWWAARLPSHPTPSRLCHTKRQTRDTQRSTQAPDGIQKGCGARSARLHPSLTLGEGLREEEPGSESLHLSPQPLRVSHSWAELRDGLFQQLWFLLLLEAPSWVQGLSDPAHHLLRGEEQPPASQAPYHAPILLKNREVDLVQSHLESQGDQPHCRPGHHEHLADAAVTSTALVVVNPHSSSMPSTSSRFSNCLHATLSGEKLLMSSERDSSWRKRPMYVPEAPTGSSQHHGVLSGEGFSLSAGSPEHHQLCSLGTFGADCQRKPWPSAHRWSQPTRDTALPPRLRYCPCPGHTNYFYAFNSDLFSPTSVKKSEKHSEWKKFCTCFIEASQKAQTTGCTYTPRLL